MKDDGVITAAQATDAEAERLNFAAFARVRRDTGFHLVDEVGREARALAGIELADRAVLRGPLDHPAGAAARHRGGVAGGARAIRAERRPRRVPRARGKPERRDPQARRRPQDRPQQADLAHRARAGAAAALRRALDAGGRGREAKHPGRRTRSASACKDGRIAAAVDLGQPDPRADQPLRRRLRQGHRKHAYRDANGRQRIAGRHPRRASRAADRAGRRRGAGEQDRARAGDGRRLLLSAEPAQPRDAVAAAARLLVQADDLSRRAQQRPAAQHAGRRRADHLSADRRRQPIHARHRLLVAAQLRRRLLRHDDDAPRAGAIRRTWRRRACSTAASPASRARASTRSASSRSRRMSIRNASGTIRSCSAPSRCGRSTSPTPRRAGRRPSCWRTRPAASWRWSAASPIR